MTDTRQVPEELARPLRAWAERRPALPAQEARCRVRERLPARGPARRPAVWVAVALGAAAVVALVVRAPQPRLDTPPVFASQASGPAVIVFELDSGTRLYFTPARRTGAGPS